MDARPRIRAIAAALGAAQNRRSPLPHWTAQLRLTVRLGARPGRSPRPHRGLLIGVKARDQAGRDHLPVYAWSVTWVLH
jgi:hypothetical protein